MTRMRQLAGAALVLGVALLAACRPQPATGHGEDAAGTPAAVAAAAATAFQQDLEGVWVTGENTGDDAETVFRIESTTEHGLRVVMDDTWLSGQVDDVDTDGNTLTMHLQSATGPEETITLRKVPGEGGGDGFHLRLTWGNGIAQELGFVRRLSPRDREQIAAAVANARQADALGDGPLKPDACDAEELPTLRLRKLCNDQHFAVLDEGMRTQFKELAARYPDGDKVVAAAERQLDACRTEQCLRDAYAHWQAYFDDNYDLGIVLDYL